MQLLVSVRSALEAREALAGGADIIDAKEPLAGALGPVTLESFRDIAAVAAAATPLSAALGDGADERLLADAATSFAAAGAALVKVGFARIRSHGRIAALLRAAADGAGRERVVAVAYADHPAAGALPPSVIAAIAAGEGIAGILMDTASKHGPGLRALISDDALAMWTRDARRSGLFVALAGQLRAEDLPAIARAGADVIGVRGAACDGGRSGRVSADRVRALHTRLGSTAGVRMGASLVPVHRRIGSLEENAHVCRADPVEGRMRTDA